MIPIESQVTGKQFRLQFLEENLKPLGYVIGGNWDYTNGSFDYKLGDEDAYLFLRVPFTAVKGALDERGTEVEMNEPYLLAHKYQDEIDEDVRTAGTFNQFQSPIEKDAPFPSEYAESGRQLVKELEHVLLNSEFNEIN